MNTKSLITQRLQKIASGLPEELARAIIADLQDPADAIVERHAAQATAEVMAMLETQITESSVARRFAYYTCKRILDRRRNGTLTKETHV